MAERRRGHRVVGEDGELGLAVRAARGHHERVARLDGVVAVGPRPARDARAGAGQPGVEREHGVARVPRASQAGRRRRSPTASSTTRRAMGGSVGTPRVRLGRHDQPCRRPRLRTGWRAWLAGARPRTLPAAVVPVLVGTACAAGEVDVSAWRARRRGGRRARPPDRHQLRQRLQRRGAGHRRPGPPGRTRSAWSGGACSRPGR